MCIKFPKKGSRHESIPFDVRHLRGGHDSGEKRDQSGAVEANEDSSAFYVAGVQHPLSS